MCHTYHINISSYNMCHVMLRLHKELTFLLGGEGVAGAVTPYSDGRKATCVCGN